MFQNLNNSIFDSSPYATLEKRYGVTVSYYCSLESSEDFLVGAQPPPCSWFARHLLQKMMRYCSFVFHDQQSPVFWEHHQPLNQFWPTKLANHGGGCINHVTESRYQYSFSHGWSNLSHLSTYAMWKQHLRFDNTKYYVRSSCKTLQLA